MKFATLRNGTRDGALVLVSRDAQHALPVPRIATSLLDAVQRWDAVCGPLGDLYDALNAGDKTGAMAFDPHACSAPLPRSPQWLDASAFLNHGRLMEQAFNVPPIPNFDTIPVMYQGASDDFLGPFEDVPLPSEAHGIDFEGEFGVVLGHVPMAASPEEAARAVRLIVQINDWSLRALGQEEMQTGFGFLHAKPSTSFAPIAVTPDELGDAWRNGRVQMRMHVQWNGERVGEPHGGEMNYSFGQLIAHAARTRRLTAGCIIGSGTVSNQSRTAGSACIAERRIIEKIDQGEIRTGFMRFGDRVCMQAKFEDGRNGPFGEIQQRVVQAAAPQA
ncbi:fumarylacetoacetate hydrolase family protein (plasmid) [Diaphorobacter sp. HDW4B]|uniref:fumarylacetoacetate hydrolase family protein n=1 Tax=Diaphorobacter sp. HDW4B TaxID=2714925 RepID=UPI00140CAD9A|nr:fumarylacetoacetate hydrolase family protein [Diaphorobacter sp. HDW4B]QIL74319.1 fumarylacetoacetate hydrolase family protein [Diaphorobacter sp. HDW4B]